MKKRATSSASQNFDPSNVDEYIASFEPKVGTILAGVRAALHKGVPDAEEKIRYKMPAVMLGGRYAIHFAGWKEHIGLYPVPEFQGDLEAEIKPFRSKKNSVTFKYAKQVPYDVITRMAAEIVRMRKDEAKESAGEKAKKDETEPAGKKRARAK